MPSVSRTCRRLFSVRALPMDRPPRTFRSRISSRLRRALLGVAALAAVSGCGPPPGGGAGEETLRWGTSAVGSSGHRAMVNLAALLNRELEGVSVTVRPMPGAIMTIRGYAAEDLDGFYGADVSFHELATDSGRFEGYLERLAREPVQSFWAYSMAMGLAIRAQDRDEIRDWGDLDGRRVFTGPGPWDTRAHLERLLRSLEVTHRYVEIDLGMAASQLEAGAIDAIGIYVTGRGDVPPWIAEAELSADLAILNPSGPERHRLEELGFETKAFSVDAFRTEVYAGEALLSPFYYGFHLGLDFSAEQVYRLLTIIEANAERLAEADPVFRELADDMPGLQRLGIGRTIEDARVHPGLARYLRERGHWDASWDDRVATAP